MCLCRGKHGLPHPYTRKSNESFSRIIDSIFVESDESFIVGKVPSGIPTPTEDEVFKGYQAAVLGKRVPSGPTIRDLETSLIHQWYALPLDLKVTFVEDDPYTSPEELFAGIRSKDFKVFKGAEYFQPASPLAGIPFEDRPWLNYNDLLRALHDFYGHYLGDNNFSWDGEHGAFLSHAKMFPVDCRGILEAEVLGQASWRMIKGEYITPQPFVSMD
jgi:hypothetical protein